MKTLVSLFATTALLGACATAPPASSVSATPGSATQAKNGALISYVVTQDGVTHTLPGSGGFTYINDGVGFTHWATGGAAAISGFSVDNGSNDAAAAGLDGSNYFAGISGTLTTRIPIAGTANYAGAYAFVVNGVDLHGALALTADFTAGTLVDTTAGIEVNGTISGASIDGTVTIAGETGTLKAGLYNVPSIVGAAVGPNMAGIIAAY